MFNEQVLFPVLENIYNYRSNNAFCINDTYYTYEEFGKCISGIVELIDELRISKQNIGLVTNNDLETYATIFALWIRGCAYVPLHIKQPLDRCVNIIEQVKIKHIFDSSKKTRYTDYNVVNTRIARSEINLYDVNNSVSDKDLAYILFTSGSTGLPKGVMLSRGNVGYFMDSFWATGFNINREDKCLQCFDLTFDVSVQCYLSGLIKGACVYTVPYGEGKYLYVAGLMEEYSITIAAMAPSMLRYMKPFFNQINLESLKSCILTAEACPKDILENIYSYNNDIQLYDFYGPTEATIYCTAYKLSKTRGNKEYNGIISIGKPLKHVEGIIIKDDGSKCKPYEKGELCVSGEQISIGYWENSEKNATSFFFKDGLRFYHTGDLCYCDEGGDIMYSGRIDNQVKIQGYRIELGEIEHHSRIYLNHPNVICVAKDIDGQSMLYLVIEGKEIDTKDLKKYLSSKLPSYMVPSKIVFLDKFPLNNSDKVDRNKIKQMI